MRRIAALTLALLLLLGSCGAPEPEKEEAAAEVVPVQQETEETEVKPALPDELNFGGKEFNLLSSYYNDYS